MLLNFLHGVFSRLHVLTRHPRILVLTGSTSLLFVAIHIALSYTCCSLLSVSPSLLHSFFRLHLVYEGKCQDVGRPEVAPEMTPKTLSGGQSVDDLAQEPSVYRESSIRHAVSLRIHLFISIYRYSSATQKARTQRQPTEAIHLHSWGASSCTEHKCPSQKRDHLFKVCLDWKMQQKILWGEVHRETRWWKSWWKIRDILADGRCGQMVLDFLSSTDAGRLVPPLEDGDIGSQASE